MCNIYVNITKEFAQKISELCIFSRFHFKQYEDMRIFFTISQDKWL